MKFDKKAAYAILKSKDRRFDGRLFVGVSSTGIYCRPVCYARLPKFENCTFYETAAEAEKSGYRPCLLCRPELAPGSALVDTDERLIQQATRLLEASCHESQSIQEIANQLGCSDRHLRRVFQQKFHVTPIEYLQTSRLLLAKNLLTDTKLKIIDVAMASGFGSVRRFNALFKQRYHMSPTALRKSVSATTALEPYISLELGYRPPYQWTQLLLFLSQRLISGVELVKDNHYYRTVSLVGEKGEQHQGWIKVGHAPKRNALTVTVSVSLVPVLPQVIARVRNLFDLYCEPYEVFETLQVMNELQPDLCKLGVRLPGCFDPFELTVRAILGQQISVKAAGKIASRFAAAYGTPIQTDISELTHTFPGYQEIVDLPGEIDQHLGPLGIIKTRARTIHDIASEMAHQHLNLESCVYPEKAVEQLLAITGIGTWTAQYIAMRALSWPDAFPHTDHGVKKALAPRTEKEILTIADSWRPWRAYAVMNLWQIG